MCFTIPRESSLMKGFENAAPAAKRSPTASGLSVYIRVIRGYNNFTVNNFSYLLKKNCSIAAT